MKLKLTSWNIRGLNKPKKHLVIKNLLREWKGDVVCLLETKLSGIDQKLGSSLWSCSYMDFIAMDADDTAGDSGYVE